MCVCVFVFCAFVGLDKKMYKYTHCTYIKIVYLPLLTVYCSYIVVVINRLLMTAYEGVGFYIMQGNSGITFRGPVLLSL